VRAPAWLPCRLQIYFKGPNWLATQLRPKGIGFTMLDNAFARLGDWHGAHQIADRLQIERRHRKLDLFASRFCPIHRAFGVNYHWSVDQCEYATGLVFRKQSRLQPLYKQLNRTAVMPVSTSSLKRRMPCSAQLLAASSTSAGCKTRTCAAS